MSINGRMDQKLWYIYTMEYYSAIKKNTFESVLMGWMKLEPIIQSEVSQKEKHKYSKLMHIYMGFRKMVLITLYARQRKRHMYRTVFWTLWKKARVGWFERTALKHVYYDMWNRSPVQVWCMRQGVQGWCTGMMLRDGMGREVGAGFRMGNTCTSVADSFQFMAKPLQYCKVISLQLKYIIF